MVWSSNSNCQKIPASLLITRQTPCRVAWSFLTTIDSVNYNGLILINETFGVAQVGFYSTLVRVRWNTILKSWRRSSVLSGLWRNSILFNPLKRYISDSNWMYELSRRILKGYLPEWEPISGCTSAGAQGEWNWFNEMKLIS